MSKVSGKIRAMERRQAAMEEIMGKVSKSQDLHSRHVLLMRLQLKQNNKYTKHTHQHLVGNDKGRKGLISRVRTLEVRQKGIIGAASLLISAAVIGFIGLFR